MIRKIEIQKFTKYEKPELSIVLQTFLTNLNLVKSFFSLADYADFADNFAKNLPNL